MRLYFEAAMKTPQFYEGISNHTTKETGHGRIEKRYYWLSEDIEGLSQKTEWKNLKSIGMARICAFLDCGLSDIMRYQASKDSK